MKCLQQLRRAGAPLTAVTLLPVTPGVATAAGYHLVKTYKLGGDGGLDYLTLDPARQQISW